MDVLDLLGKSEENIKLECADDIVSINNINRTIELCNVSVYNGTNKHNALLYFDLVDKSTMLMIVMKCENVSFRLKLRLNALKDTVHNGYVCSITYNKRNEVILAYVRKNINSIV